MTCTYTCASPSCRHDFTHPNALGPNCICPSCGSLYVRWQNFDAWFCAPGKTDSYTAIYGLDGAR